MLVTSKLYDTMEMIFGQVNGNSIISLDTETIPTLLGGKKNPHQGRVRKVGIGHNVMVFQNKSVNGYEAMVHRRLQKEGKDPERFDLSPRNWGRRIDGTPFVEHNCKHYLEVIFLNAGSVHYTLDGEVTPAEFIEGLDLRRQEAEQGGLTNKVILRDFAFESLRCVTIGGARHIIR